VLNFNDNAADWKRHATGGSEFRHRQTSSSCEVNRNWNAGDTETEAAGGGGGGADAAADESRKVSILDPAAAGQDDDDEEETGQPHRSASQEAIRTIAKLRRLSAIESADDAERPALKVKKRRSSAPRPCIRRCIAEDETWDLKTVPDLDMLIAKYFADDYAGTSYDQ